MNYIGLIPARYASTRFPGKPLAILGDKPVIQHVYEQARKALETVYVATDDTRIADCVRSFGGEVVMTRPDHTCGTDRCLEAYEKIGGKKTKDESRQDIIINIQGDEPFVQPEQIEALKSCFHEENGEISGEIATLVIPYQATDNLEALENPNSPKVVVSGWQNGCGKAVLFSRSVIPYMRGVERTAWLQESERRGTPYYRHLGMYAYRADILSRITQLPQSPLELTESLEQLRWLEAGYEIKVGVTKTQTIGIDTPEDLEKARLFLQAQQEQKK